MVLRFDDTLVRACAIVTFTLISVASGHTVLRIDENLVATPEANNDVVAVAGTNAETGWMVTAIIFIVLFALSIIVCIYLWYLRNAKVKELRYLQNIRTGSQKANQNVWYGGGAHM